MLIQKIGGYTIYFKQTSINMLKVDKIIQEYKMPKNEKPVGLENVTGGDWIFTIKHSWTKVAQIDEMTDYPIKDSNGKKYTFEGKYYSTDVLPSAWTYNPFDLTDQPPVEFKPGEVIMVRDVKNDSWIPAIFSANFSALNYPIQTAIGTSWRYARKLTPTERGES